MISEPLGHKATGRGGGIHKKVTTDVAEVKGEVHDLMSDDGRFPSLPTYRKTARTATKGITRILSLTNQSHIYCF